ncbi:ComEA family DNA-binding protein [Campylobacter gastrosuis]|uniref:Helix-hairpin-helix domain-containing protein n=1 Tax=Campylobacter gastrosuis TaxID=2974576 RepID=A0ABT7HRE5_9BACT|nr:helix-hairpin-helix domain-containing protein [Campylobacter gastrosuis]MDL0089409.1 helix-hairpin-helix domain-containing protein [Campylobacter gastrosuis]
MRKFLFTGFVLASALFAAVNINTATKEELMSVKGIGETKANAIIEYRKTNEFKSLDELKNVKGIGNANFEKIKNELSISGKTEIKTATKKAKKADKNATK